MNNLLTIFLVFLTLSSCATGPSQEQLDSIALEEKIKTENTDLLVDIILKEFWNKKLLTFRNPQDIDKTHITRLSRGVMVKNLNKPSFITASSCLNLNLSEPPPLAVGVETVYLSQPRKINAEFKYDLRRFGYTACNHQADSISSSMRELSPRVDFMHIPILDAWEIQKRLLDKGMPLIFCFKNKSTRVLECSFDTGQDYKCGGSRCSIYPTASLYISTSNGMLKTLRFEHLTVSYQDEFLSLAEIYYKRFQDPEYVQKISAYFNVLLGDNEAAYRIRMAEEARIDLNMAAYERERKRQSARAMNEAFGSAINNASASFKNHHNEFKTPDYQSPTYVEQQDYKKQVDASATSTSYKSPHIQVNQYMPAGQSIEKLQSSAQFWCSKEGGTFDISKGSCNNPTKDNCLKTGRRWMGDRCQNKDIEIEFLGRACSDPSGKLCKTGETVIYNAQTGSYDPVVVAVTSAPSASGSQHTGFGNNKPHTPEVGPDAWAYCWKTKLGHFMCDGPLQLMLHSEKTLSRALESTDCPNGKATTNNWYDCGRKLKWTELHKERDVRSLRKL